MVLAGVETARADSLTITLDNPLRIVLLSSTAIYTGTVTDNTRSTLDATNNLFLISRDFNPVLVDLAQLLGTRFHC